MTRRTVREQLFKLLFRVEFQELADMDMQTKFFYDYLSEDKKVEEEAIAEENEAEAEITENPEMNEVKPRLDSIISLLPDIDKTIADNMTGWTLDRLGKVELTLLRIGTYEICHDEEVPDSVAINEAVELTKKYGPEDSAAFVNAILGKIQKNK